MIFPFEFEQNERFVFLASISYKALSIAASITATINRKTSKTTYIYMLV